jgi:Tat protein translocase TatB subunit
VFNVGSPELLVILVVALLVLGPNKLPEVARQVGKAMGELRRLSAGFQAELRDAIQEPVASRPDAEAPFTPEPAVVIESLPEIEPTVTFDALSEDAAPDHAPPGDAPSGDPATGEGAEPRAGDAGGKAPVTGAARDEAPPT